MKRHYWNSLISCAIILVACSTTKVQPTEGIPSYVPENKALYDTIVRLDSLFFEAYNTCKMGVMDVLIVEDVEFYHDKGGFTTSKQQILDGVKNNVCNKSQRELLKGSIEVYPIPGYGAVQIGAHRFRNIVEKSVGKYARFVHTWQWKDGKWQLKRVISLH